MMIVVLIMISICAVFAIRATRLLVAILWLAVVSALMSLLFYLAGAWFIAVIELSIGTGLATVLMVFVITMIGDEHESVPLKPLSLSLLILTSMAICLLAVAFIPPVIRTPQASIQTTFWQMRGLDILPQIGLIFVSMTGVLAIVSDRNSATGIAYDGDADSSSSADVNPIAKQRATKQEAA